MRQIKLQKLKIPKVKIWIAKLANQSSCGRVEDYCRKAARIYKMKRK